MEKRTVYQILTQFFGVVRAIHYAMTLWAENDEVLSQKK